MVAILYVICISTTCMLLVFITLTVFMLVLLALKYRMGVMVLVILAFRIISVTYMYLINLLTKGIQITKDVLYCV